MARTYWKFLILFTITLFIGTNSTFAAQVSNLAQASKSCTSFNTDLRFGIGGTKSPNLKPDVIGLQQILMSEGYSITTDQMGYFGVGTFQAVRAFQDKYKNEVLLPAGLSTATGYVGTLTRQKLTSLYSCQTSQSYKDDTSIKLAVNGVLITPSGITATLCNEGNAIPTFPIRVRLNGIIREFNIDAATEAHICYPAHWAYETWGLSYEPGVTYNVISTIDPFNYYKKEYLTYPDLEEIAVPAVKGIHRSVRSLTLKQSGIQATLCNLGSMNVDTFNIRIRLNGEEKLFNISNLNKSGQCMTKNFSYDNWNVHLYKDTTFDVQLIIERDNLSNISEFSSSASIRGSL